MVGLICESELSRIWHSKFTAVKLKMKEVCGFKALAYTPLYFTPLPHKLFYFKSKRQTKFLFVGLPL